MTGEDWNEPAEADEEPEEEAGEPSLEGLSPEAQAQAEKWAAAQVAAERKEREKILAGAQEMGMTFGADGRFGVTDLTKLTSRLGAEQSAAGAHAVGGGQQSAPAPAQAPAEDVRPSMYEDPDGYAAWMEREMDRRAGAAVAGMKEENERLKALMYDQGARTALAGVEAAVTTHAPIFAPAMRHPDFLTLYEKALENQPPEFLRDSRYLAKVAGWVVAELDPARMPEERSAVSSQQSADPVYRANREALPAGGGRGSMPVPRSQPMEQLSGEERKIMQAFEQVSGPISREMMQALEHTDIGGYETEYARLMRGKTGARK